MPAQLAAAAEEHGDLEDVALLEGGIVPHVPLLEAAAQGREHARHDLLHLLAQAAARLAEEGEDEGGALAQDGERSVAGSRRRSVRSPATTITATIASWTTRPERSGWIPIQGISGNDTGRGGR